MAPHPSRCSASSWAGVSTPLGNDIETERAGQTDHRGHDHVAAATVAHPIDEGPVDLDGVDGEQLQVAQ